MRAWWRVHKNTSVKHCERCNGIDDVHRGWCRKCRAELLAEETPGGEPTRLPPVNEAMPPGPELEPPHGRPWVHRGSGTG